MTRLQPRRPPSLSIDDYQYDLNSSAESDDPSMPSSPSSVSSDTSTESWANMSQLSQSARVTRHPEYYIESGDVVFLVESTLFKVHRHFFARESQRFRDLIYGYGRGGPTSVGFSAVNPIELNEDGITAEEFGHFLWVFYNPEYSYNAPVAQWTSILRLSHLWGFAKVKALAVREMDAVEIPPVDRAVMAREFAVDPARRWLEQAFAALGAREEPLTKSEGLRLGLDAVLQLARVRERIRERRQAAPVVSPKPLPRAQQLAPDALFEQRSGRHSGRSSNRVKAPALPSWASYNPAAERGPELEVALSPPPSEDEFAEEKCSEAPTPESDERYCDPGAVRQSRPSNQVFDPAPVLRSRVDEDEA